MRFSVRVSLEELGQACFVKIAHWRLAVGPDPFRMLPAEIVVNLLLKFGQSVCRMAYYNGPGHNIVRSKHKGWTREALDCSSQKNGKSRLTSD